MLTPACSAVRQCYGFSNCEISTLLRLISFIGSIEANKNTFKSKPKQNRFKINQSVVLQNMNRYRNRSIRDSVVKSKNSHENNVFSSIGSGKLGNIPKFSNPFQIQITVWIFSQCQFVKSVKLAKLRGQLSSQTTNQVKLLT